MKALSTDIGSSYTNIIYGSEKINFPTFVKKKSGACERSITVKGDDYLVGNLALSTSVDRPEQPIDSAGFHGSHRNQSCCVMPLNA